jgi:uncharacterized protein with PhoU and TrkA domain
MGEIREIEDPMKEVMDLFLEMKDTSELMVDLAYSSLLYNNHEIASEVEHLNEMVDEMSSRLQRIAISSVSQRSTDATIMLLKLCTYINSIADAAMSIVDVVLRDIEPHPVIKQSIKESDVGIYRMEVKGKSILSGKHLSELRLATETGMWVFAIKRNVRWIYGPEESDTIEKGDIIFVRGPEDGMKKLRAVAKGKLKSLQ